MRNDVVVPGKFDVFARTPQRRLNSVVLPVLGLPIRTTRASLTKPSGVAGVACVTVATSGAGGIGLDEDAVGHRARQPDARRSHLHDARVAGLAEREPTRSRDAERAQQIARSRVELSAAEPYDCSWRE